MTELSQKLGAINSFLTAIFFFLSIEPDFKIQFLFSDIFHTSQCCCTKRNNKKKLFLVLPRSISPMNQLQNECQVTETNRFYRKNVLKDFVLSFAEIKYHFAQSLLNIKLRIEYFILSASQ